MIDYAAAARALVERTCAEQGLPVTIDDEATLRRVAALLARHDEGPPYRRTPDTLTPSDATTVKASRGS